MVLCSVDVISLYPNIPHDEGLSALQKRLELRREEKVSTLAELEEEILREVELKPYFWWRYIDDIFLIWEHGGEKLKEFIDVLNKKHPTIKFTAEWSKTQINFLDVTVSLENGKIKTDLYVKPSDTHQYLHSSSCHPYHCKKGIS